MNDPVEYNFTKEAQKGLSHDRSYWIGGSTDSAPWSIINLNDLTDHYNIDSNTGDLIVIVIFIL